MKEFTDMPSIIGAFGGETVEDVCFSGDQWGKAVSDEGLLWAFFKHGDLLNSDKQDGKLKYVLWKRIAAYFASSLYSNVTRVLKIVTSIINVVKSRAKIYEFFSTQMGNIKDFGIWIAFKAWATPSYVWDVISSVFAYPFKLGWKLLSALGGYTAQTWEWLTSVQQSGELEDKGLLKLIGDTFDAATQSEHRTIEFTYKAPVSTLADAPLQPIQKANLPPPAFVQKKVVQKKVVIENADRVFGSINDAVETILQEEGKAPEQVKEELTKSGFWKVLITLAADIAREELVSSNITSSSSSQKLDSSSLIGAGVTGTVKDALNNAGRDLATESALVFAGVPESHAGLARGVVHFGMWVGKHALNFSTSTDNMFKYVKDYMPETLGKIIRRVDFFGFIPKGDTDVIYEVVENLSELFNKLPGSSYVIQYAPWMYAAFVPKVIRKKTEMYWTLIKYGWKYSWVIGNVANTLTSWLPGLSSVWTFLSFGLPPPWGWMLQIASFLLSAYMVAKGAKFVVKGAKFAITNVVIPVFKIPGRVRTKLMSYLPGGARGREITVAYPTRPLPAPPQGIKIDTKKIDPEDQKLYKMLVDGLADLKYYPLTSKELVQIFADRQAQKGSIQGMVGDQTGAVDIEETGNVMGELLDDPDMLEWLKINDFKFLLQPGKVPKIAFGISNVSIRKTAWIDPRNPSYLVSWTSPDYKGVPVSFSPKVTWKDHLKFLQVKEGTKSAKRLARCQRRIYEALQQPIRTGNLTNAPLFSLLYFVARVLGQTLDLKGSQSVVETSLENDAKERIQKLKDDLNNIKRKKDREVQQAIDAGANVKKEGEISRVNEQAEVIWSSIQPRIESFKSEPNYETLEELDIMMTDVVLAKHFNTRKISRGILYFVQQYHLGIVAHEMKLGLKSKYEGDDILTLENLGTKSPTWTNITAVYRKGKKGPYGKGAVSLMDINTLKEFKKAFKVEYGSKEYPAPVPGFGDAFETSEMDDIGTATGNIGIKAHKARMNEIKTYLTAARLIKGMESSHSEWQKILNMMGRIYQTKPLIRKKRKNERKIVRIRQIDIAYPANDPDMGKRKKEQEEKSDKLLLEYKGLAETDILPSAGLKRGALEGERDSSEKYALASKGLINSLIRLNRNLDTNIDSIMGDIQVFPKRSDDPLERIRVQKDAWIKYKMGDDRPAGTGKKVVGTFFYKSSPVG
ncbi:MAG: hypothetical protein ACTSUE_15850 [Promethearchaeota archaeon]